MGAAHALRWPGRMAISGAMRRRRFATLRSLLEPLPRPLRILDVGGTQTFWESVGFQHEPDVRVLILNREAAPVCGEEFASVAGDARDLSQFADDEFDLVFSNSVIEHVGGIEEQRRMAREVMRVGRRFTVQTPNRYFPIEPHFAFPFFQFLPISWRVGLLRRTRLGFVAHTPDASAARERVESIRLLSGAELAALFPGATIHRERLCGLTKSFTACGGFDERFKNF